MATKKITEYAYVNNFSSSDVLLIVTNVATTPLTRIVTGSGFFGAVNTSITITGNNNIEANTIIVRRNETPSNSSITIKGGTIFFDNNYIYVAISNNEIKRASLSAF